MSITHHSDGRTQIIVIPGDEYVVNGERLIFLSSADGARCFVRPNNGEIVTLRPGEILTFKDGE